MRNHWMLVLCGVAASIACSLTVSAQEGQQGQPQNPAPQEEVQIPLDDDMARALFQQAHAGVGLYESAGRITKVHGVTFGGGPSPHDAAERFRTNHSGIFGVPSDDLIAQAGYEGGKHLQPIMYQNGQPKFTGVNYTQVRSGLPVYRSRLILLARNLPNYPLVLATADLRDLGAFVVDQQALQNADARAGVIQARKSMPEDSIFSQATPVIFAGVDDNPHIPTLALNFIGEGGNGANGTFARREFVTDAATGAILYTENLVYDVDVHGTVSGMATNGYVADACASESLHTLPYLRVSLGATNVFADVDGNFLIPNSGSSQVTLNGPLVGQHFVVNNEQSPTSSVSVNVTPPGPAALIHNATNSSEGARAEVNAYLHANLARDVVVAANPAFPTVGTQTNFPINVNIGLTCNAFYSSSSINFYVAGDGCHNSAFGTVVHHEYGHNVVAKAGSGQGAYGEGTGDVLAVLVSDGPLMGVGLGSCSGGIRTANNSCQYQASGCSSCGSSSHSCGQLISGCVWSLRNNLAATDPANYRTILADLAVNSILLHTGSLITPQITIDYLTLDDDDADQSNGTPHRTQIANAFAAHGMPAPPLPAVLISFPDGRPPYVAPAGGTIVRASVNAGGQTPAAGATLFVDTGSGFVGAPMTPAGPNLYDGVIPASACGTQVRYYVSAQSTTGTTVTSPLSAPTNAYDAISAAGLGEVIFSDNFNSNLGWTISNNGALTDGPWTRGVPIPLSTCSRGNPGADADGSGSCYLTDNSSGGNCNSDVDGGVTTLTSPNMDASSGASVLSYWRWYDNLDPQNATQDDPLRVEFSVNGGSSWQELEVVGPTGAGTNGGWVQKNVSLNDLAGFTPTSQLRVRFLAQDDDPGSVVEAAVDGVKLQRLMCSNIIGDINGDGLVNVNDLLAVITAFGSCPAAPASCPADIAPFGTPDGQVNVNDLLMVITNFG